MVSWLLLSTLLSINICNVLDMNEANKHLCSLMVVTGENKMRMVICTYIYSIYIYTCSVESPTNIAMLTHTHTNQITMHIFAQSQIYIDSCQISRTSYAAIHMCLMIIAMMVDYSSHPTINRKANPTTTFDILQRPKCDAGRKQLGHNNYYYIPLVLCMNKKKYL